MLLKAGPRISVPSPEGPVAAPAPPRPRGVLRPVVDLDATIPLGGHKAPVPAAPEVLAMRCLRCQGPIERGTAPVSLEGQGYRMVWEQVPAWVCTRCELAYFEPEEVETVREALRGMRALKTAGLT
jgi:YgiT-type zinc finger domain-containing protein